MINSFSEQYFFLSNFYNCYLIYEGIIYCSTEAAFQAAKTLDINERKRIAKLSPSDAKKAGRKLELRPDWEEVKDKVMYDVCLAKFTQNDSFRLKERLLATGNEELIEGNTWHDNCWGDCNCEKCKNIKGENRLGKILMKIRKELKTNFDEIIDECISIFSNANSKDLFCLKRYENIVCLLNEMKQAIKAETYPHDYPVLPLLHYFERHMDSDEMYNSLKKLDEWYADNYRKS